jgi:hypothetical protein
MRNNVMHLVILSLGMGLFGCGQSGKLENASETTGELKQVKTQKVVSERGLDTMATEPGNGLDSGMASIMDPADTLALDSIFDDAYLADDSEADPNTEYAADPELSLDAEWEVGEDEDASIYVADAEMDVKKDRLIATSLVRVLRPEITDQRDSVLAEVEKRLTITPERIPATVVVEKWISPVNFKGYKFNQRKLLLFGVREDQSVVIYYYINQYYFALDERFYELDETLAFESFQNLADTALVRHLRTYENSL